MLIMLMIRLLKHLGVLLPMLGDASEEVGTSKPFNEYRSYICVLYVSRPLILEAYSGISFELNIPFLPQKINLFFIQIITWPKRKRRSIAA